MYTWSFTVWPNSPEKILWKLTNFFWISFTNLHGVLLDDLGWNSHIVKHCYFFKCNCLNYTLKCFMNVNEQAILTLNIVSQLVCFLVIFNSLMMRRD